MFSAPDLGRLFLPGLGPSNQPSWAASRRAKATGGGLMALRMSPEAALHHPLRAAILQVVRETPGQNFLALGRRLGVAPGTLRHHLAVLTRTGLLRLEPVGSRLAILPADERRSPAVVALLCDPDLAALRDFVASRGRVYQRQIIQAFPAPRSTTNNRLKRLAAGCALRVQRQGRCLFYEAAKV
jgi:DNA-binding transcriptional ArsR family regulator